MVVVAIKDNVLAERTTKEQVNKYMKNCDSIVYLPNGDRSIISQMNEMIIRLIDTRGKLDAYTTQYI